MPAKNLPRNRPSRSKTLLQYSPSSTNSQPWHFIVASTEEGKARVAKSAADNYVFNERKMLDASHVVVFCAKTAMDDARLKLVVDQKMPMAALPRRKRKPRTIKVASSSPICTVKICMMMQSGWQNRFISTSVTFCWAWRRWVWTRCPSKV